MIQRDFVLANFGPHAADCDKRQQPVGATVGGSMSQAISASLASAQPAGVRLLRTFSGHNSIIHRLAWSPDGRAIASPARDGTVRVWDFKTGNLLSVLEGHRNWVNTVAWSPDGCFLASGTEDGTLFLWSVDNFSCLRKVRAHRGRIECIAWSSQGNVLASGSGDGTVAIWRINSGEEVRRLDDHHAWVNAVAWSPNGRYLATGAEDPSVKLWDAKTFELLHTMRGHEDWVTEVVWAPDSAVLASASGKTIRLWNPVDGSQISSVIGHMDRVKCLSFSSDGSILASKGRDNAVRLWRSGDWEQVFNLDEPTTQDRTLNPESNLAFHPSAPVLATLGEMDTVIRLWALDLDSLLGSDVAVPAVFYRSAKVVLMGASSTGKSCLARAILGLPFVPQESTHGMKVWALWDDASTDNQQRSVQQEIFLWDLAGQSDYTPTP
jgi:WD40 repeat protein